MKLPCTALSNALFYMGQECFSGDPLAHLTDRQREICRMYFIQGMNQDDIAEILKIEQQTVSEHVKAANAKIKRLGLNPLIRKIAPSFSRNQKGLSTHLAAAL